MYTPTSVLHDGLLHSLYSDVDRWDMTSYQNLTAISLATRCRGSVCEQTDRGDHFFRKKTYENEG